MRKEKPKQAKQNPEIDSAADHPESVSGPVLTEIESNVYCLVDEYINTLDNPEMLTDHSGVFVDMLKYIYKGYIQYILNNSRSSGGNRYDYKLLDNLFNIYTHLVYMYKKNKQPYINEFCIFTHIDKTMLYRIKDNMIQKATPADVENVKQWFSECEQAQLNGAGITEIFKLKAMYRYNDNLAPLPVEYQTTGLTVADLPKLGQNNSKKLLSDHHKDPKKGT